VTSPAAVAALSHVAIVGGAAQEWHAMSASRWSQQLTDLGKAADHLGIAWLTVRPYRSHADAVTLSRKISVGRCEVVVDGRADGKARLVTALAGLRAQRQPFTDSAIAAALNHPAPTDPDLIIVLGPSTRLPTSVVWELAYSELVFSDVAWPDFDGHHLELAASDFATRHRRFGGID
jgi:hypothetical protein